MKVFDIFKIIIRLSHLDKVLRIFTAGKKYDSLPGKMIPNLYQYPAGTIRRCSYNGIRFEVDIHDYYGNFIYFGFFDSSQNSLFGLCRPGDTIIDIGTNIGFSLLNMAKIAGTAGQVIGFEPDGENFSRLRKNISLNNFGNVKVSRLGLGDRPGKFMLENIIEYNNSGKRITVAAATSSAGATEVEIDTLDNFISSGDNLLPKIDLIKIDVEGFELNVLKGAQDTLRKYSPLLFIELDDRNLKAQSASAQELIRFLSQNEYAAVSAENNLMLTEENNFTDCHYDIICRRKLHT